MDGVVDHSNILRSCGLGPHYHVERPYVWD